MQDGCGLRLETTRGFPPFSRLVRVVWAKNAVQFTKFLGRRNTATFAQSASGVLGDPPTPTPPRVLEFIRGLRQRIPFIYFPRHTMLLGAGASPAAGRPPVRRRGRHSRRPVVPTSARATQTVTAPPKTELKLAGSAPPRGPRNVDRSVETKYLDERSGGCRLPRSIPTAAPPRCVKKRSREAETSCPFNCAEPGFAAVQVRQPPGAACLSPASQP